MAFEIFCVCFLSLAADVIATEGVKYKELTSLFQSVTGIFLCFLCKAPKSVQFCNVFVRLRVLYKSPYRWSVDLLHSL